MIAIINYGSGNIRAIENIYGRLGIPFAIASTAKDLAGADRIVLPGVGAFDQAMTELERSGMRRALDVAVLEDHKPILGICVGMQLLAKSSEEGQAVGLGWIDGVVKRFDRPTFGAQTQLPHMGWNSVKPAKPSRLFANVDLEAGYYFLHSYYFACADHDDVLGTTGYGSNFTSAVHHDNIFGVQFHPEKSHQAGIELLKNFADMV